MLFYTPRHSHPAIATFGLISLLSTSLAAQSLQYSANSIDQTMRADVNVDPSTLNMSFRVTLANYPGRGVSLPVVMNYASKVWRLKYMQTINGQLGPYTHNRGEFAEHSVSGWTTSVDEPYIEFTPQAYDSSGIPLCLDCDWDPYSYVYWVERVIAHLPNGETHELRRANDQPVVLLPGQGVTLSGVYTAVDGSRLKFDADAQIIYLPDGSRYFLASATNPNPDYVDRNGNWLEFYPSTKQWKDTLERFMGLALDNSSVQAQTVTLPSVGGGVMTFTLDWKHLSQVLTAPGDSTKYRGNLICQNPYNSVSPSLFTSVGSVDRVCADAVSPTQANLFDPIVLNQIILPNGRSYTFTYTAYGEIDKVVLPTGGYERYLYSQIAPLDSDQAGTLYSQTNRGVTSRYESATGLAIDEKLWQHSVSTPSGEYWVTATDPNGARTERELTKSAGSPGFGFDDARTGRSYEERVYTSTNQMWRRTLTQWDMTTTGSGATRDPRPIKQVQILLDTDGNALATATMAYDADLNQTSSAKYSYASVSPTTAQTGTISQIPQGSLLRTDETTWFLSDPDFSGSWTSYRNRHLLALPTKQLIKDSAGTTRSETRLFYDERALSTYATVTGWTDPATTVRGNLSTTQRWLNYPAVSWVITKSDYDQCGSVRKATDANNKDTLTFYSDLFSDAVSRNTYAYPTEVDSPVPDPTGASGSNLSLKTYTTYDFQTGKITKTRDPNNRDTLYSYYPGNPVDPVGFPGRSLNRLQDVTRPDGGQTTYDYADDPGAGTPGNINVLQKTKQDDTGTWLSDYVYFDGLGRPWRSAHLDTTGLWSVKDTKYDGLSRVAQVSNPYWVTSLTTPPTTQSIWTITSYDALGRILTVTPPDSAVTTTNYGGNLTTVTDPAGKARQTESDALGQLSQVVEAPGGLAYPTTYAYDTLGNLTSVTQGEQPQVQTRTFAYDSLSRLVTATNPESGTLQYEYDANGNLTKRTDCLGTVTQYDYDGLNRVKSRTYAEGLGVSATPDVTLTYDGVGTGGANSLGRLSTVANSVSSTLYTGYDPVGRVSGSTQLTDGQARAFVYAYDRAGHMVTEQYPSGRTVSSAFDSGGRASWTRGNFAIYSYQFDYDAGQLTRSFRLGNGLYEQRRYNNRLQLRQIGLGQNLSGTDLTTGECNRLLLGYQFGAPGQNNGDVSRQTITFPGKSYTEDYTYDTLNRLFTVAESGSSNWNQTFTYDRYGNLTQTGDGVFYSSVAYDANTNRVLSYVIPGFGTLTVDHDCAGNIKQGTTYTYDAENRVTSYETTTYSYDGEGRRIKKVGGGVTSVYAYDAEGRMAAEYSTAAPSPAGTLYLTADHLGSTRIVTNNYGAVVSRHDYRPFGLELLASGSNPRRSPSDLYGLESIRQKFTGKERDPESGLDYFGARYYWNSAGRFTSPDPENAGADPEDPQSWNAYAYARNNPLLYTDPTGEAYRICDTQGNCNKEEISDSDFRQYQRENSRTQIYVGGNIYARNEDGTRGKLIGTYEHLTFDELSRAADLAGPTVNFLADATIHFVMLAMPPTFIGSYVGRVSGPTLGLAGLGSYGVASTVPNLNGMSRAQAEAVLTSAGGQPRPSGNAGYVKYEFPDGSNIWLKPNGEVVRIPKPGSAGKGWQIKPDGTLARPHKFHREVIKG